MFFFCCFFLYCYFIIYIVVHSIIKTPLKRFGNNDYFSLFSLKVVCLFFYLKNNETSIKQIRFFIFCEEEKTKQILACIK